jgi:putative N6-adenine-specific DNA methylase
MRASQEWTFFCIIAPGLEDLAIQEFHQKQLALGLELLTPQMLVGGFEITCSWELGRGLVHLLKIPTRVIVRLTQFKARDFPKVYKKISELPWTKWISHPKPQWKVSAHECRLIQTTRLEETLDEALELSFSRNPLSLRYQKENLNPETLYLRGYKDNWTLSLDITGEALYKRKIQDIKGAAPIRETLASACLFYFFQEPPKEKINLWDPMCGSGTFLNEAMNFHLPLEKNFNYLTSILNLGVPPWKPKSACLDFPIEKTYGSDINQELIAKTKKDYFFHDFLKMEKSPINSQSPLWIIMNPPYGERLSLGEPRREFIQKLATSVDKCQASKALIVTPADWPKIPTQTMSLSSKLVFSNGGLAVEARLFKALHT